MRERECAGGARLVAEREDFVAFVPFAATAPFETWIFPSVHRSSLADVEEGELEGLGRMLAVVLAALRSELAYPAYKLVVRPCGWRSVPASRRERSWYGAGGESAVAWCACGPASSRSG